MEDFYKYRSVSIICLMISVCLLITFFVANDNERNRFMNFNRSTVPDDNLELIKSPTPLTLSFNKFYHLDSIQWHDAYGKQVINIPTICYNIEGVDYSNITIENYGMPSPYHLPLDEKQYSIIHAMEILADCNFSSYQKMQAPAKVTIFDYLNHGLPQIFYEKAFKPLLRILFDNTFYVRDSSSKSIIKAISLNKVGKITSVHLYNGETLYFDEPFTSSSKKTYENLFQASLSESSKRSLIKSYENRLEFNSIRDFSQEAEILAKEHIDEINKTLLTEKIEFLGKKNYNSAIGQINTLKEYRKTAYPNWISWLLGLGLFIFLLSIILIIIAISKKEQYKIDIGRQNELQFDSGKFLESIFDSEKFLESIRKFNSLPLNERIKLKMNYSDLEMISIKEEIVHENEKSQQDKKTAHLEEHAKIEKDLHILSQATQTGNIELAEEKIKTLSETAKSSTVDKELVEIIEQAKNDYIQKYTEGISDTFDKSYIDYIYPSEFVQGDNWNYAVAKFPSKGTFVFPYRRRKIARRGYMEKTFHIYLKNMFSGSKLLIIDDCAILPAENYRPYEPDIAIIDIEHPSIRIDIEIDEPYSAITNKPIHYIGCGDDFRDMNLNNLGWIVVRFTEYQVKSNMQDCASFIAKLIHSLNPSKPLPKSLLEHNIPQTQKRWTEIEAMVMASEKVREKYLNHEFGTVDSEQIEITDIKQTEKEKACAKLVKPLIVAPRYLAERSVEKTIVFERDKHIQFLPQEHIYLYNGQEQLIPVSSVISCFFRPFDSFYWSKHKANQHHIPQGQVLEEWDAKGACSRDVGTFMHQQIENYYKGLLYLQEFPFRYKGKYIQIEEQIKLESEYSQFMEFLKNHKFKPFRTEWAIYDEELKIAGTIDMIHKRGDVFDIYDWKRSHRIVNPQSNPITINNFGEKGLGELCQIDNTPYWHYCIQQNLYRYILEKNYAIKVEKMYLVVFCKNTNKYSKLEVPYMDEAINSIVKACRNGTVKKYLISLREENLS